jgi:hypothetical protein
MTKKDYELIVRVISRTMDNITEDTQNWRFGGLDPEPAQIYSELIHNFASELKKNNERFDTSKFYSALKF